MRDSLHPQGANRWWIVRSDPSNAEAWIETAMQRNPVLVSTRLRAEIADGDVEAQRSTREDLERVALRTGLTAQELEETNTWFE